MGNFDEHPWGLSASVITAKVNVGVKQSVEVSSTTKASVLSLFDLELSGKYGREWSQSTETSRTTTYTLQPGKKIWWQATINVQRDIGDLTIKVGNTTLTLTGVYVDHPVQSDQAAVTLRLMEMTADSGVPATGTLAVSGAYGDTR